VLRIKSLVLADRKVLLNQHLWVAIPYCTLSAEQVIIAAFLTAADEKLQWKDKTKKSVKSDNPTTCD